MRQLCSLALTLICFILILLLSPTSAQQEEVHATFGPKLAIAIERYQLEKIIACMEKHTCKNALTIELPVGSQQIIFTYGGKQYTFYISSEINENYDRFLSVWVKEERLNRSALTFTDYGLDGIVDFGRDSDKTFRSKNDPSGMPTGEQYFPHWQANYFEAIATALETLL